MRTIESLLILSLLVFCFYLFVNDMTGKSLMEVTVPRGLWRLQQNYRVVGSKNWPKIFRDIWLNMSPLFTFLGPYLSCDGKRYFRETVRPNKILLSNSSFHVKGPFALYDNDVF